MPPRALLLALLLAFVGLAGCDALGGGDADDVTGIWTGQLTFVTDTLLTNAAVRIAYDMEQTVELRLLHEDGLVRGTVSRTGSGTRFFRSASGERDSSDVSSSGVLSHEVYGTFVDDRLELEVQPRWKNHPTCGTEVVPYASTLFSFGVSGDSGQSDAYVAYVDSGVGSDDEPFTVSIRSDERLRIDRGTSETPELADVTRDPARLGLACAIGGDDGDEATLRPTALGAPAITVER